MAGNVSDYLGGSQGAAKPGETPDGGGGQPMTVDADADQNKPDQNTLLQDALNFLGKQTALTQPGTVSAPLTGGLASTPAAFQAPQGPIPGTPGAGAAGPRGESGLDILGLIKGVAFGGVKGAQLLNQLYGGDQTRGNVGGEGTTQQSDQSLSDVLRSASGLGGSLQGIGIAPGGLLGAGTTFSTIPSGTGLGVLNPNALAPGTTFETLGGVGAVPGAAGSGLSGLSSGLSAGGLGAGAAAAILGALAQATGNADLGKAATALGAAGNAASLAGTAAALPGVIAGGTAGIGTAAGAAFAPIAAFMLIDSLGQLFGKEEGTFGLAGGIGDMMKRTAGRYPFFSKEVNANIGQQNTALDTLNQALPFVRTREELGQLLNTYGNYLGTTQQAPVEQFGIEGTPYSLGKITSYGPVTHGQQTPGGEFGPALHQTADLIGRLYSQLPGDALTAKYGEPGGGLTGEAADRVWNQFRLSQPPGMDPEQEFSQALMQGWTPGTGVPMPGMQNYNVFTEVGKPYWQVNSENLWNAMNQGTISRTPTWDPTTGQWVFTQGTNAPPKPGDYWSPTTYWKDMLAAMQAPAAAPAGAAQAAQAGPGFIGNAMDEIIRRAAMNQ